MERVNDRRTVHIIAHNYIQKKRKRIKNLTQVSLTAVRYTGNPNHHSARLRLEHSKEMRWSVFVTWAPIRMNDYVSFYSVKETLTGDQYNARYPV